MIIPTRPEDFPDTSMREDMDGTWEYSEYFKYFLQRVAKLANINNDKRVGELIKNSALIDTNWRTPDDELEVLVAYAKSGLI